MMNGRGDSGGWGGGYHLTLTRHFCSLSHETNFTKTGRVAEKQNKGSLFSPCK